MKIKKNIDKITGGGGIMLLKADDRKWTFGPRNSFYHHVGGNNMKMAKKLLAVVLAGVLALSVLTGCGNAASTKTIAEAMSDMGKAENVEFKADSKLNEKAKAIANKWVELENTEFDTEEEYVEAMKKSFMDIMGETYKDKYVFVAVTETKGYNVTAQAYNLLQTMDNINDAVDKKETADVFYVGTATITVDGEGYRLAVMTADAVENKV